MPLLKLYCFGGLKIYKDDQPITTLLKKTQAFLAYLTVERKASLPRDKLCAMFWPESGEMQAKYNLRYTLWVLRTGLGFPEGPNYEFVLSFRDECQFNTGASYWLDTEEFEKKIILAKNLEIDDSARIEYLTEAVNLYRGDFLDGFFIKKSWEFENWQRIQRERFFLEYTRTVANLADLLIDRKEYQKVIALYNKSLLISPVQEEFHQGLIRLYLLMGERTKALEQYERCREVLKREMRMTPAPETQELRRSIFQAEPEEEEQGVEIPLVETETGEEKKIESLNHSAPSPSIDLDEILKDVPDGLALSHKKSVSPPFVNREKEIVELSQVFNEIANAGAAEVVFIKGELGIGKTRLIEEFVAQRSEDAEVVYCATPHLANSLLSHIFYEGGAIWLKQKLSQESSQLDKIKHFFFNLHSSVKMDKSVTTPSVEPIFNFFSCLSAEKPLILITEDLHWLSPSSLDIFYELISKSLLKRILFIATYRPEDEENKALTTLIGRLQRIVKVKKIPLARLSYEDVSRLLQKSADIIPDIAQYAETIYFFTEGIPFLITLIMEEFLSPQFKGTLYLPDALKDIVAERVKRLSAQAFYLLKIAAVLGNSQKQRDLLTASKMAVDDFLAYILELVEKGFINEKEGAGEITYTFTHRLLPAVILEQMSLTEKNLIKERCSEVIVESKDKSQ